MTTVKTERRKHVDALLDFSQKVYLKELEPHEFHSYSGWHEAVSTSWPDTLQWHSVLYLLLTSSDMCRSVAGPELILWAAYCWTRRTASNRRRRPQTNPSRGSLTQRWPMKTCHPTQRSITVTLRRAIATPARNPRPRTRRQSRCASTPPWRLWDSTNQIPGSTTPCRIVRCWKGWRRRGFPKRLPSTPTCPWRPPTKQPRPRKANTRAKLVLRKLTRPTTLWCPSLTSQSPCLSRLVAERKLHPKKLNDDDLRLTLSASMKSFILKTDHTREDVWVCFHWDGQRVRSRKVPGQMWQFETRLSGVSDRFDKFYFLSNFVFCCIFIWFTWTTPVKDTRALWLVLIRFLFIFFLSFP